MNSRALLLVATLVMSPVWAQVPSLDLDSDAVKNILRATAATQFAIVKPVEETKAKPKPEPAKPAISEDALVTEKVPVKARPSLPVPTRRHDALLSAVIDVAVDTAIDAWLDEDDLAQFEGCRYVDSKVTSLQFEVTPECLKSATYQP